jgi:alpha,alpha-trehalase
MAKQKDRPRGLTATISHARAVPIGDYGFLSDGEVSALLAPSGSVDWMCVPRFDSASVFGAILGRHAGRFRVAPLDVVVPADRRYLPGTMILETSWGTPTGWIIVRDALLIGPWHHADDRSRTYRRTPNDYEAEHVLLRTIRCVSGEVQTIMDCEPVLDYGRRPVRWEYSGESYHAGEATADGSDTRLTLTTDMLLGFEGGQASTRTLLKEGDVRFVALSWGGADAPRTYADAYRRQVWTAHHWQHWLARGRFPDHPWRSYLQRSALTLKGLTYAPTGAVTAAGSASLPETPGGDRNYDYRFTWIRDATFALWGMYSLGFDWEAIDFFAFIADIAERDDNLQIMYGIGAERDLEESQLDHLSGYAGSRPVRIGNAAYAQQQHDVWGALLDSVYLHTKRPTIWTTGSGRSSTSRSARRSSTGASRMPASGRCGASSGTSRRRRSCAGSLSTAVPGWRGSPVRTPRQPSGSSRPTRSRRTSWPTASTRAAC